MYQASVTAPLTITNSLKQLEADVAGLGNKWHGTPKPPLDPLWLPSLPRQLKAAALRAVHATDLSPGYHPMRPPPQSTHSLRTRTVASTWAAPRP